MNKFYFFLIFIISSSYCTYSQGIYFWDPDDQQTFYSGNHFAIKGAAVIGYVMGQAPYLYVSEFRASIDAGSEHAGGTGSFIVTQAGAHIVDGRAWAMDWLSGTSYQWYEVSGYLTVYVVDNDPPSTPQGLQISQSGSNHPILNWTLNSELDISHYEVWKKGGNEGGDWHLKTTTTSNSYEDPNESVVDGPYQANEGDAYYKIKAVDINNNYSQFSSQVDMRIALDPPQKIASNNSNKPNKYFLSQNFPNPFNPSTNISYQIKETGFVTLKIYDLLGRKVADLVNEVQENGQYSVMFNASELPTGVYIYSLRVNDFVQNQKMTLTK